MAVVLSIFSYLSIEMIAVAAGEAERPVEAVRKAFRATLARLVLFYLLSLLIILAVVPWDRIGEGNSPFVTVMQAIGIPYAAGVLNFVVIVAALSAMNSMLYITTRMMFSLSRGGDAPARLGALSGHGVPINALILLGGLQLIRRRVSDLQRRRMYFASAFRIAARCWKSSFSSLGGFHWFGW